MAILVILLTLALIVIIVCVEKNKHRKYRITELQNINAGLVAQNINLRNSNVRLYGELAEKDKIINAKTKSIDELMGGGGKWFENYLAGKTAPNPIDKQKQNKNCKKTNNKKKRS